MAANHNGHERDVAECLALAEQSLDGAFGPERAAWMQRLEQEHPRFVRVLEGLAQRGDVQRGLELAFLLQELWFEPAHTAEGRAWLTRLLALPAAEVPPPLLASALDLAGALALNEGDYAAAQTLKEDGLVLLRQAGDPAAIGFALMHLGHLYGLAQGDYAHGRRVYEEAYALLSAAAHPEGVAHALANRANMAILMQDYAPGRELTRESLRRYQALGHEFDMAHSLIRAAGTLAGLGHAALALRLAGAGTAHLAALGVSEPPIFQERFDRMWLPARLALPAEAQSTEWAKGQALGLAEAVELALSLLDTVV